ncbi:ATP-binding protein [Archangium lansingense]|uniref:ATP-binding protein n=1 Tax=Archangium lansingense TaxID=2995310 RepID=UPI003B8121F4
MMERPPGVGKSFLACALGQKACRDGYGVVYRRTSRLFDELAQARADGTYPHVLRRLAKAQVLILDNFGLEPLGASERKELLDLVRQEPIWSPNASRASLVRSGFDSRRRATSTGSGGNRSRRLPRVAPPLRRGPCHR